MGVRNACDAGVRAHGPGGSRGQPAQKRSRCAGRPDTHNVWHAVSYDKALRAKNLSQLSSGWHA
ncbi:hypothetical protein GCM10011583_17720 [Streptomyces camponoticapitis]|uniref:Uncharacterized protein n=1 Tax=Streptomyces camponoticapitis TaxID=1616125 RepID=A0ABQ2E211_9ACTN|nr:hypothetical protein GCM10011583_17720 [Streptomyces camponoticapitis]